MSAPLFDPPSDLSAAPPDPEPAPGAGNVAALAWPMTLKAIFLHGTVVIDGWLVSSLGETSVAAMGFAAALGGMILGVIFAFSHAMQIRTAQAFGTGDKVFLKSTLASGLAISFLIGTLGVAAIFSGAQSLVRAMATSPEIAAQAWAYLSVFALVILGESMGQVLSSFFNGCGRTRVPFYGYCLSVPINVGASMALIHGLWGLPAYGVAGAAMGSALAVLVQVAFFALHLLRKDAALARVKGWRQTTFLKTLRRHIGFSLPIVATFVSANFASHLCVLLYARMDLFSFAALALITPWNMVAGQLSMQWTQATGILVAQLLGKETSEPVLDRFLSAAWRGAFVAAAFVALTFVIMTSLVDTIYPDLAPETRAILVSFLPILILVQFPRATNAICGNTLRASGDTIYVMHIFIWSQWAFRVPATAIAILYFELGALWILGILLAEEAVKFLPFHTRLWRGDWKRADVTT
ncbi:MAG: MATE family efflux transporter [Pseudomonadota bacterium]